MSSPALLVVDRPTGHSIASYPFRPHGILLLRTALALLGDPAQSCPNVVGLQRLQVVLVEPALPHQFPEPLASPTTFNAGHEKVVPNLPPAVDHEPSIPWPTDCLSSLSSVGLDDSDSRSTHRCECPRFVAPRGASACARRIHYTGIHGSHPLVSRRNAQR